MKKFLILLSILILLISLSIRNDRVYYFRVKVLVLVVNYNEKHYYGQIKSLDDILPSYNSMLFSVKPLKYEYWIDKKNLAKLTQRSDILI